MPQLERSLHTATKGPHTAAKTWYSQTMSKNKRNIQNEKSLGASKSSIRAEPWRWIKFEFSTGRKNVADCERSPLSPAGLRGKEEEATTLRLVGSGWSLRPGAALCRCGPWGLEAGCACVSMPRSLHRTSACSFHVSRYSTNIPGHMQKDFLYHHRGLKEEQMKCIKSGALPSGFDALSFLDWKQDIES